MRAKPAGGPVSSLDQLKLRCDNVVAESVQLVERLRENIRYSKRLVEHANALDDRPMLADDYYPTLGADLK